MLIMFVNYIFHILKKLLKLPHENLDNICTRWGGHWAWLKLIVICTLKLQILIYYFDNFSRLREILMVASANIKTPSMEVPFLPNVSDKAKDALRISLNKVTLANVLEAVHVTETIQMSGGCRKRLIKMRFEFLPKKQYKNQVCTSI